MAVHTLPTKVSISYVPTYYQFDDSSSSGTNVWTTVDYRMLEREKTVSHPRLVGVGVALVMDCPRSSLRLVPAAAPLVPVGPLTRGGSVVPSAAFQRSTSVELAEEVQNSNLELGCGWCHSWGPLGYDCSTSLPSIPSS
jgi:hypothetical protein